MTETFAHDPTTFMLCANGTCDHAVCELCGQPMPRGEETFRYHGYSGPCPVAPLPQTNYSTTCPAGAHGEQNPQCICGPTPQEFARIYPVTRPLPQVTHSAVERRVLWCETHDCLMSKCNPDPDPFGNQEADHA